MSDSWLFTQMDPSKREQLLGEVRGGRLSAYREMARGDEFFGAWLFLVDLFLRKRFGVTHADLADHTWRDAYAGGDSPREAAEDALRNDDAGWLLLGN